MARRRCMPPENPRTTSRARAPSPTSSRTSAIRASGAGHAVERRGEAEVLHGRHFVVERGFLGQHADAGANAPRAWAVTSSPSTRTVPRDGRTSPQITSMKRRLAGAVGPDDADHRARVDPKRQPVERLYTSKAARHVDDVDSGHRLGHGGAQWRQGTIAHVCPEAISPPGDRRPSGSWRSGSRDHPSGSRTSRRRTRGS